MSKFLYKLKFWLNNARLYTGPITWLSWLVIYCYGLKAGGNWLLGLITLPAISLVHLATNLADDYFDYQILCSDEKFLDSAKECKCHYLRKGMATINDLRNVIIIFLSIAALIGLILFFLCGPLITVFALCGLIIALSYSKLSSKGLGDIAVITAYGPLMFEGVYYVMTGNLSSEVLLLSIACAIFVNTILYAHMLMDYDQDVCSHKTTICTKLKSKDKALLGLTLFYGISYLFIIILSFNNIYYLLALLTFPLVAELYKSLKIYSKNIKTAQKLYLWNYPLNVNKELQKSPNAQFFYNFFFAINISTIFMILCCIGIFLY